jgi:hypothetical protein
MITISGQTLEFIYGVKFVVCIGLVIFFSVYLTNKFIEQQRLYKQFRMTQELKIGWSLTIFALGDAITHGTVWYSRHLVDGGRQEVLVWTTNFTLAAALGTILCSWGGLCALRVCTPREIGEWPWLMVGGVAIIASAIAAWG